MPTEKKISLKKKKKQHKLNTQEFHSFIHSKYLLCQSKWHKIKLK